MTVKRARSCGTSRSFGSSLGITGKFTFGCFHVLWNCRKIKQLSHREQELEMQRFLCLGSSTDVSPEVRCSCFSQAALDPGLQQGAPQDVGKQGLAQPSCPCCCLLWSAAAVQVCAGDPGNHSQAVDVLRRLFQNLE